MDRNGKPALKSTTVQSSLLTIALVVSQYLGLDVSEDSIADVIINLGLIATALGAIWGRFKAEKKIDSVL